MFPSESKPTPYSGFYSHPSLQSPQQFNTKLNYISSPAVSPALPSPPAVHPVISQPTPAYYYSRLYDLPSIIDSSTGALISTQPSPQSSLDSYLIASPPQTHYSSYSAPSRYAAQEINPHSANSCLHASSMPIHYAADKSGFATSFEQGQREPKTWPVLTQNHALQNAVLTQNISPGYLKAHASSQAYKDSSTREHLDGIHVQVSTPGRIRRRSLAHPTEETLYPAYYPAHPVPLKMQIVTGPPDSWKVTPPRPEEIRCRKYASGVDERNFFTVLEYEVNSQPIIWDYYTGYVHLTGIWKAIGNSKADIVKLLDNSPELESVIKRVRGGFLKIQGTWVPYEVARKLALHVCFYVRYALVPLFGATFPEECTRPTEPGFGMLQLNAPRKLTEAGLQNMPRTVSTPSKSPVAHLGSNSPNNLPLLSNGLEHADQSSAGLTSPRIVHSSLNRHSLSRSFSFQVKPTAESGFKRRFTSLKNRTSSAVSVASPRRDSIKGALSISRDAYDENVLVDEEGPCISSLPMPRKVSLSDEQRIISESPSEFLAMLKATRSLQQMSAGRFAKHIDGGFECGEQRFTWDGIDKLDVLPIQQQSLNPNAATLPESEGCARKSSFPAVTHETIHKQEPSPPLESFGIDRRSPSLAKILNV